MASEPSPAHSHKLHVWGNPKKDIAAYREVRKAVGGDYVLMFDAACAYNHEEALWVGKQLEEIGCYFYESPLRDYDLAGMRDLADQLTVPTAVAEMVSGSYFTCAHFVAFKAGDILRGDVTIKGGISPLVKLAHLCEAFGMMCEVHTGGNTYADMANLHVICAIKNCAYFEMIVPSDLRHFGLKDGPLEIDQDGYVHVSKKPGVGLELDWDRIEAETIY